MMFAELTGLEIGGIIVSMACGGIGILIAAIALFKSNNTVISPQPLIIAMQKEFATKHDFDTHVAANTESHDKLFSKIGGVERGANTALEMKVEGVRSTIVNVSNQVAGLKSQTDLQNQHLARMDSKLDRLAERKNES